MSRFWMSAISAIVVAGLLTTPAQGRSRPSIADEIRKVYADYDAGVRRMTPALWRTYLTSDFVMKDPEGKLHPMSELRTHFDVNERTTKRVTAYSNSVEAVTPLAADRVAVIVVQKYTRVQAPLEKPTEDHTITTSVVQREYWRRAKQGWRKYQVEELLNGPVIFDGKVMTD